MLLSCKGKQRLFIGILFSATTSSHSLQLCIEHGCLACKISNRSVKNDTILHIAYTHRRQMVRCFLCVCTLLARLCIHLVILLAAVGAYRTSIERGPLCQATSGYKINQHPHKGLEIPGLFIINTSWICQFLELDLCVCVVPLPDLL